MDIGEKCICECCGVEIGEGKTYRRGDMILCSMRCVGKYHWVDGELVKIKELLHGSEGMYRKGCRCNECRAANAAYHRAWRKRNASHGAS